MEKELAEIFRNVAPTAAQKRRAVELAMNNPLQKSLDFIFQAARLAHSYMRPESEPSMSIRDDTVSLAGDDEPIGIVEQSSAEIPEQPASSATTTTAKRPDSGRKRKAELPSHIRRARTADRRLYRVRSIRQELGHRPEALCRRPRLLDWTERRRLWSR